MKNLIFLIRRAFKDIIDPFRFNVSEDYLQGKYWPYALDYTSHNMLEYYDMSLDDKGIILMSHYYDHIEKYNPATKHYYSPVKIAHYGLGAFNDYLKTKDKAYLIIVEAQLKYLSENFEYLDEDQNYLVWRTDSSNPKYNLEPGYISAIVNGLVISFLIRAYQYFNDKKYLNLAEQALRVFELPVEDGGLLANSIWGPAYEEYPGVPYSHVVNGFMFALIGIMELHKLNQNILAKKLYDEGKTTIVKMLDAMKYLGWCRYDLHDHTNEDSGVNLATRHYQYLHLDLLDALNKLDEDKSYHSFMKLIERQLKNPFLLLIVYGNKFQNLILKRK